MSAPASTLSDANVMAMIRSVRFSSFVYKDKFVTVTGTTVPFEYVLVEELEVSSSMEEMLLYYGIGLRYKIRHCGCVRSLGS
jgi:hypothetical protein